MSASPSSDATLSGMIIPTVTVALYKWSAHMAQVNQRFVMTCLIFWGEPQIFSIDFEGAVHANESFLLSIVWIGKFL